MSCTPLIRRARQSTSSACRRTRWTPDRLSIRAVWVWEETSAAQARARFDPGHPAGPGLAAAGELGDHRPMVALSKAVSEFEPDRIVISTHPEVHSAWFGRTSSSGLRKAYSSIPVRHIVAHLTEPAGG